jgi:hypothetical protein
MVTKFEFVRPTEASSMPLKEVTRLMSPTLVGPFTSSRYYACFFFFFFFSDTCCGRVQRNPAELNGQSSATDCETRDSTPLSSIHSTASERLSRDLGTCRKLRGERLEESLLEPGICVLCLLCRTFAKPTTPAKEMAKKNFRVEVLYNPKEDQHYATLTGHTQIRA